MVSRIAGGKVQGDKGTLTARADSFFFFSSGPPHILIHSVSNPGKRDNYHHFTDETIESHTVLEMEARSWHPRSVCFLQQHSSICAVSMMMGP